MSRNVQGNSGRRAEEQVRELIATILSFEISDPRLALVTVTGVALNSDRTLASVYVTCEPGRYSEALDGLNSAKGRIRSLLGHSLSWRVTPELRFFVDESIDEGARIDDALRRAAASDGVRTEDE